LSDLSTSESKDESVMYLMFSLMFSSWCGDQGMNAAVRIAEPAPDLRCKLP
jgi:hypothetical protein